MVMPDALGITYVSDLSPKDLEKVCSVALLELTVTFDDHGIPLRPRRQAKVKSTPGNAYSCLSCSQRNVFGGGGGDFATLSFRYLYVFIILENSIFGVPLSTLVQNDRQRDSSIMIPLVFEEVGPVIAKAPWTSILLCLFIHTRC